MAVVKGTRNTETIEACFHMLREAGADLDARDSFGCTPLHHVAEFSGSNEARLAGLERVWPGCLKLASLLLRHGADVHVTDRVHHASPLHSAIFCPALTALLVKAGADVNLLDGGRRTPLYTALYRGTKYQDDRVRGTCLPSSAPAPKYQAISDMHWIHLLVLTAIQMLMAKSYFCIFKR